MDTKKCIGIVTICDYTNYGNRLQNIALTKFLENEGYKVVNDIQVYTKRSWVNSSRSFWKRAVKRAIPFVFIKSRLCAPKVPGDPLLRKRRERFVEFGKSYAHTVEPIATNSSKEACEYLSKYGVDKLIAGSDQIWNPYFAGRDYQFLQFAPKSKRFSYAASIGVDKIPEYLVNFYRKCLTEMRYISVREEKAAEIIKELTGTEAHVSLDPTLLLDEEAWLEIAKKPNIETEQNYICSYFLGEPAAEEEFSRKYGLPVYKLNSREDKELFVADPAEFLYMIKNASYVLTDSFHAVVFSVIFHRQFYVFQRKKSNVSNMFSRIESLLSRLGLEDRILDRESICETDPIDDWARIDRIIERDKKESASGLLDALEESDE